MIKQEGRLWLKGEELYSFDLWLMGTPTHAFHSISRAGPTLSLQYAAQLLKVMNTIDNRVGGIMDSVLVVDNSGGHR